MQSDINYQDNHKKLLQKINKEKDQRKKKMDEIRQNELIRLEKMRTDQEEQDRMVSEQRSAAKKLKHEETLERIKQKGEERK